MLMVSLMCAKQFACCCWLSSTLFLAENSARLLKAHANIAGVDSLDRNIHNSRGFFGL